MVLAQLDIERQTRKKELESILIAPTKINLRDHRLNVKSESVQLLENRRKSFMILS